VVASLDRSSRPDAAALERAERRRRREAWGWRSRAGASVDPVEHHKQAIILTGGAYHIRGVFLRHHIQDKILGLDLGKPRHVIDKLLRVNGDQLPAELTARLFQMADDLRVSDSNQIWAVLSGDDAWSGLQVIERTGKHRRAAEENVWDARPTAHGSVALKTTDGGITYIRPDGIKVRLATNGYASVWNHDGRKLSYVQKLGNGGATMSTAVHIYDTTTDGDVALMAGLGDTYPTLAPDSHHVLFVSGRSQIASFWIAPVPNGTNSAEQPWQLCNFGLIIDASFVPLPSNDPVWDEASDRVFYETHYGDRSEIWSLILSTNRDALALAGFVAEGSHLSYLNGRIYFLNPDGRCASFVAGEAPTLPRDFGARSTAGAAAAVGGVELADAIQKVRAEAKAQFAAAGAAC
jgi:hypothetical protein